MNTCPACGAQYPSTVRLCTRDGTVLETAPPTDAQVGRVLDGKYRLDARLNAGGMGTVYKATHLMLGKQVAVKLINAELVTSPEIVRRFQREARAASALNHPNIAPAYDLGQTEDGTLYIAMEFVAGHSLREVIRNSGQLDTARIVRILRQVASALSLAHRHEIIHRDLKPHNIMLATDEAGREVAKLLDFGIAKTFDDAGTQLTATGFALGTPQYMSPEQATGQPVDGRSDLYALGVILYEMLIGEVPFNDPSTPAVLVKQVIEPAQRPSLRRPDLAISPELEAIALRCLEKDPAARYQSAEEFAAALEPLVGSHATLIPSEVATVVLPATGAPARAVGPTAPTTPAVDPMAPTVVIGDAATKTARPAPAPQPQSAATARATPIQPPPTRTAAAAPPAAATAAAPAAAAAAAPSGAPAPPGTATAPTAPSGSGTRFLAFAAVIVVLLVGIGGFAAYGLGLFGRTDGSAQTSTGTVTPPPPVDTSTPTPPPNPLQGQLQPVGQQASSATGGAGSPGTGGSASAPAPPPPPPAAGRPTPPPASGSPAGGSTAPPPVATQPPPPPPAPAPAAPAKSEIPTVFFRCSGSPELCPSIRSAVDDAFEKESIPTTEELDRADIVVDARVALESETTQQMFGATFVVRTFTTEVMARAKPNRRVPMAAPMSVSFDPRNRVERAAEHGRLVAAAIVDRILRFVGRRGGGGG